MKKLILVFLFIPAVALASEVVVFDGGGTAILYKKYAHTPDYEGNPNAVINPPSVPNTPMRYWKRSGNTVIEMTAGEKATVDQAIADALAAAIKQGAQNGYDGQSIEGLKLRATIDVLKDEINILRALHGQSARTLSQFKTAVKAKIANGDVDE